MFEQDLEYSVSSSICSDLPHSPCTHFKIFEQISWKKRKAGLLLHRIWSANWPTQGSRLSSWMKDMEPCTNGPTGNRMWLPRAFELNTYIMYVHTSLYQDLLWPNSMIKANLAFIFRRTPSQISLKKRENEHSSVFTFALRQQRIGSVCVCVCRPAWTLKTL